MSDQSTARLREMAAAMAEAATATDVAEALVGPALAALRADLAAVTVPTADGAFLRLVASKGLSDEARARLELMALDAHMPMVDAFRTGQPVWIEGAATLSRYQAAMAVPGEAHSAVAAPILARRSPVGAVGFGFRAHRHFDEADHAFLRDLSALAGVALERASLLEAERAARHAAELERARLRQVLDQMPVGVMIASPAGEVAFGNRRAQQILGTKVAGGSELTSEEYPLERALRGEAFEGVEVTLQRADGSRPVVSVNAAPLRAEDGSISGAVVTYFDVSERRQVEEERAFLAEASATLAGSFDYRAALSRVAWLAVPRLADHCFVDLFEAGSSRRIEIAHGRPLVVEDLDLSALEELGLDQEHAQRLRACSARSMLVAPLLARGQTLGVVTMAMAESGRRYRPAHVWLASELARTASTAIDNALLIREAQAARAEAEAASRAKDEFLAMLGHELRNPLAPIVTALELMKLRGESSAAHERKVIERQVQNLMTLVDDLLDVSRITRGKIELKRRPAEVFDVLATALEIASPLLEQRRHAVHVEVPRAGLAVLVDETRLSQVFANLLTNAAKYTEPGGNVWLRARRVEGKAIVEVRDDGIGIAAELLPDVFELFVQGHKSIARAEGGLGLGLTLVRSLVLLHGGEVFAKSDGPGKGSTFTVQLSALGVGELLPTPVEARRARQPGPRARRRVLVVDDNEDAAGLLGMALRDAGCQVEVAHDGAQALERLDRFQPEVAVLDIGLPVMDGYELAARLRERGPGVRLIALTGYGQEHDRSKAIRAGFERHLVKPVELEALLAALDQPPA